MSMEIARAAAGLFVVIGMIGSLAYFLTRTGLAEKLGANGGARDLRIADQLPLGRQRRLVVLRWGEEEHLVLIGAQTETVIAARPAPLADKDADEDGPQDANPFHALARAVAKHKADREGDALTGEAARAA